LRVGEAKRAHHNDLRRRGGHGASAPLPTLGFLPLHKKSSYSAKAEYPVRRSFSAPSPTPRNTGSPAFAGDDSWECGALVRNELLAIQICKQPLKPSLRANGAALRADPLARNDVDTASHSRGLIGPSFARNSRPLQSEGAGNAGRPMRPPPHVQWVVVERTRVSQVTPESPGIPRAMVYGLYVLSPVTGLSCHRRRRSRLYRLDASVGASGPHDFAVRINRLRQERHPRPPHPAPR
jgi:hypothetical protein